MKFSEKIYKPKVSVIIPVYNVKQYLAEALDSVINQTYKNLEIIVIDDGSDDGSELICEEYAKKDSRIKLIHKENGGLSSARNTGLDNISGEYVAFLDSDDAFLTEAIEQALYIIQSKDVDCVTFRYIFCDNIKNKRIDNIPKEKISPTMQSGIYSKNEVLNAIANLKLDFLVWTKLSKCEIWDNVRFPKDHIYEDLYIVPQFTNNIKNVYVDDRVFILHRRRDGSITNTVSIKQLNDLFDSWAIFKNFVKENTPEIFDQNQAQKIQKYKLSDFIVLYSKILSSNCSDKLKILNLMKTKIKYMEKSIKIKNCSIETRLAYYMIFNHPQLLSIFYPLCRTGYKIIKKIMKKI